ncbi:anthranilate synthase component I family protein [Nocardioides sp. ChNu-99]|uniref:anthranilate synthase component I family protein n=1 Tax=Nocardioides sp. ChNu-99 TaxID=2839897 RepID=UPI0024055EF0|nr:anthranilate synthase component I family protein [Nocardioides sp. ChNu-99]MDF9715157.1 anthranilate synthase component I family protein [Nocardioides sp. ChNu-99]
MPPPDPDARPDADLEALATAYPRCVWLDGGAGRDWSGRRSFVAGLEPDDVSLTYDAVAGEVRRWTGRPGRWRSTVVGDDPFTVLAAEVEQEPGARWFGYLGYAARRDLPALLDPADPPEAVWLRPSRVREVQHAARPASPAVPPAARPRTPPAAAAVPAVPADYAAAFDRVQEALHAGDSYEVNLTHRVTARSALAPWAAYARLREANPAPYAGFLQHDVAGEGDAADHRARAWLLGSSPERFARIGTTGGARVVETKPMKGTAPRSADPVEDAALRDALAADPKTRAENLMIVDLLRNDVASVSRPGTVRVPDLMATETYPGVHQLVSTVVGELRAEVGVVDAVRALFPAGSMTGAPKLRTMEVVAAVEGSSRGPYAGALGWVSGEGADLGVVIRSLYGADARSWRAGTGGGITVRSRVADEWAEAGWKLERVLGALR